TLGPLQSTAPPLKPAKPPRSNVGASVPLVRRSSITLVILSGVSASRSEACEVEGSAIARGLLTPQLTPTSFLCAISLRAVKAGKSSTYKDAHYRADPRVHIGHVHLKVAD